MVNIPNRRRLTAKRATLMLALLVSTAAASAAATLECHAAAINDQEGEAVCTLPPSTDVREVLFKARFLGSHDDSEVSLRLIMLNDKPVECRADNKTKSKFEDGEVTLDCGFIVPASVSVNRLTVKISLHHLQFDNAELLVK
jgi:hypothetical protein